MGGNNSKPSAEKIIDGKAIAATIRGEIKVGVSELVAKYGKAPGLAVVIVGSRPDSQTYVRMKRKACDEAGIVSFHKEMPEDASEEDVLQVVRDFNADPDCHGILVQLPLPKHMNEEKILAEISLQKDVDGFHPLNIGKLSMKGHEPLFMPCTPKGCIVLLERSGGGSQREERGCGRPVQHRRHARRADAHEEGLHRDCGTLSHQGPG